MASKYAKRVPIPEPEHMNGGLSYCRPSTLLGIYGKPRAYLTSDCMPVTNKKLKAKLITADVGPFRVYGHKVLIAKLTRIFAKVKKDLPDLYEVIGTAGSTCCRKVRGSSDTPSNHAFGTAIDLTIDGDLDSVGDGLTQLGLLKLYPYFHNEGFYWGSEFRGHREDSMHYEISNEEILRLYESGEL